MSAAAPRSEAGAEPRDSALALVLANLVPLAGIVFLGWSVSSVLILY